MTHGGVLADSSVPGWPDRRCPLLPSAMMQRWAAAIDDELRDEVDQHRADAASHAPPASRWWSREARDAAVAVIRQLHEEHPEVGNEPVLGREPDNTARTWCLSGLPLPTRARNRFHSAGLDVMSDLIGVSWSELLRIQGVGVKSLLGTVCTLEHLLEHPELVSPQLLHDPTDLAGFQEWIERLMRSLDERRRTVFVRRAGLDADPVPTLEELGRIHGVSKERIRQIQESASKRIVARAKEAAGYQEAVQFLAERADPLRVRSWFDLAADIWPDSSPAAAFLLYRLATPSSGVTHRWSQMLQTWSDELAQEVAELRRTRRRDKEKKKQDRVDRRFQSLIDNSWWPPHVRTGNPEPLTPARSASDTPELAWSSGKMNRVLGCDSTTEHRFYALCDMAAQVDWFVEQPIRLEYRHEGVKRNYYPDALIHLADGRLLLVEVKPLYQAAMLINQLKWESAQEWCREYGVGFLVTDSQQSLESFLQNPVPAEVAQSLLHAAKSQPLSWPEVSGMIKNIDHGDLTRFTLQYNGYITQQPWRLVIRQ